MSKTKQIPMRTCIGCRKVQPKKEMVRIVKAPEGNVEIDLTGKRSGRGAYICLNEECFETIKKEKCLIKALGINIPKETLTSIEESLREIRERTLPTY